MQRSKCPFYQLTAYGMRCVLASPEEWKSFIANGRKPPCIGGQEVCPFRSRVGSKH
ncbi:MAG: hypothetical protein NZ954_01710 [Thermofilaceae archaeon]|nr:hypothetical protein [Thermofilaceae archaeon]MCX8180416.1 hypothetical protein [Thermofilaceae archaeon]MDW8003387.1 hypothetical protein [Thermofilaceae archaeon]